MGMGFAPTWLRPVSPPPCVTTLTTGYKYYYVFKSVSAVTIPRYFRNQKSAHLRRRDWQPAGHYVNLHYNQSKCQRRRRTCL